MPASCLLEQVVALEAVPAPLGACAHVLWQREMLSLEGFALVPSEAAPVSASCSTMWTSVPPAAALLQALQPLDA